MKIISSKKWNEQQREIQSLRAELENLHLIIADLKQTVSQYKSENIKLKAELANHPRRDNSTGKWIKRK